VACRVRMWRPIALTIILVALSLAAPVGGRTTRHRRCGNAALGGARAPRWIRQHRMTVLVDSVLLGGAPQLRRAMPCFHETVRGRPALMIRVADRELRVEHPRVAKLVVVALGYNSLWERSRRHFRRWAARFDGEAGRLLRTLRRLGARQFVWVTLRRPSRATVAPSHWGELAQYSWYFGYANERIRRLDHRRKDLVIADWSKVSHHRGLTYDSIHVNPRGGRLLAATIKRAIVREARRQAAARR
jgi:hypothetical protein